MSHKHILNMNPYGARRIELVKAQAESRKHTAMVLKMSYRWVKRIGLMSALYVGVCHMPGLHKWAFSLMWKGFWSAWF